MGGNCVEIQSGETSILIDAGTPVNKESKLSKRTFNKLVKRAEAIFISHPHPDHYKMLSWLEHDTPIYMSRGCKKILEIAHKFNQTKYNPAPATTFDTETIEIPESEISVTPIAVDHSGFDSRAFLISDGEENILYSGDIRDHGRQNYLTKQFPDKLPSQIDSFILEGTLLTRKYKGVQSEEEVLNKLASYLKNNSELCLIAFSSQNIDRLVSVFRACLKTNRTLVIDPYTAYILHELRGFSKKLPQHFWNNMGILFAANSYTQTIKQEQLYRFASAKVTKDMIRDNPEKYVLKSNGYVESHLVKGKLLDSTTLVYSQWSGYADGIWESNEVHHIHCSGHAQIETLQDLINKINPDMLIPIHTEDEEAFASHMV
ncbi:MAG: MBL fold metallo-hydrolase [Balneolaceae bacterium]|nr:MBL fold metallo-hydrolase [Balneolaceae bacterium]